MNEQKDIKIGSIVEIIGYYRNNEFLKSYGSYMGIVTKIDAWEDTGPLTPENHGSVEVLFPLDVEHFSLYGWDNDLKIISETE